VTTKKTLTDRGIAALKPKPGRRYDLWDAVVPGLAVRVTETGHKSFVLVTRYPGATAPTRRSLSEVGAITLSDAREQARTWLAQVKTGIDPKIAAARDRHAKLLAANHTFEAVAERFIAAVLPAQRRGYAVERVIRKDILPFWKTWPIADITHHEVRDVIRRVVERGAPGSARDIHAAVRAIFSYALNVLGVIEVSPAAAIKPTQIIGKKAIRTRVLDDSELRKLWRVAGEIGHPFGDLVGLLMLSGVRLREASDATWDEFDLEQRLWTIPPERFKSGEDGAPHVVPLSADAMKILADLPRYTRGKHLFSTTFGKKPIAGFSKAKQRIDRLMGDGIARWTFHDIRRTMRTRLAELQIPDHVAELCIGHARQGVARIYDRHRYITEMREAFDRWAARLRSIVVPPPDNVVPLLHKAAP
jgi:integrase